MKTKNNTVLAHFAAKTPGGPLDTWTEVVSDKAPVWTSMEQAISMAKAHKFQKRIKAKLYRVSISTQ